MKENRPRQILDSTFRHLEQVLAEKKHTKSKEVRKQKTPKGKCQTEEKR